MAAPQETPMMKQYREIKALHPDSLLFFRLGDFYELFYEDAEIVSKELGLVLTSRNTAPMCGVPWHAHEMYLTKLINNGHKVAICEQLETPEEAKKRNNNAANAMVRRGVTRIVTKGTLIESSLLNEKQSNFLLALSKGNETFGCAYADVSTGTFRMEEVPETDLLGLISRIDPSEIICPDTILADKKITEVIRKYRPIIHPLPSTKLVFKDAAVRRLTDFYRVMFIDAIGDNVPKHCLEAASFIVEYVTGAYIKSSVNLSFPKFIGESEYVQMNHFTRTSLELRVSNSNEKKSTLLYNIDRTLTPQGARLLSDWLANPLSSVEKIKKRLDYVEFFVKHSEILERIREKLDGFPDVERALSRVIMDRAGPRDLDVIRMALRRILELSDIIVQNEMLKSLDICFSGINAIITLLDSAINEADLPFLARDGSFIKRGYNEELDNYRNAVENSELFVQELQKRYSKETGISNIKIKNNGILGYFIEVSANNASKIPYDFIHRQTLATTVRYTTKELSDLASRIYEGDGNAKRMELLIFSDICLKISSMQKFIKNSSQKVSFLDCVSSLAFLAINNNYIRPIINDGYEIDIKGGRHPVVEANLKKSGEKFISNDCTINESSIISIITGPNMGGKSTYLRQNAIIVIMAQIGSFVPAEKATIGIVDKIFSRVGANDDISSGRSTFMVEMTETAMIIRQATDRSLIIMDEIGRGTSTYDGFAIAWSIIEDIHDNVKARTLFSTHYHELKSISEHIENVNFLTVKVDETNDKIVFMHKVTQGFADKSYGIHVAKLAGFPERVLDRANEILDKKFYT
jgi:DNA mismatch repair protein MutS